MSYSFGTRDYGYGVYGGYSSPFLLSSIPVIVEWYNNTLGYKGVFQTGVGDFLGCEFTIDESGSRDFILYFAKSVGIGKKDIIKIKIFNSDDYFFTGVVRTIPVDGSTKAEYNYSGYGLNDYFTRINAESRSYAADTIADVLDDLLDNVLIPNSPIIKNIGKINPPNITIGSLEVNYGDIPDLLDQLKKLANSTGDRYHVGVDHDGEFFFEPKRTDIRTVLVVGKEGRQGIDFYEPEDLVEVTTQIYVLDKDGVYVDIIENPNVTEDEEDINRQKVTSPDVDNTTAELLAEGEMNEIDIDYNSRRASIVWKIEEQMPLHLLADGNIRILNNIPPPTTTIPNPNPYGSGTYGSGLYGGGQYEGKDIDDTLEIKEIKYILTGSSSVRQIELGGLPPRIENQVKGMGKDLNNLRISLSR